ncbi:MAG: alpha/beta hydrolase [Lachnospiraceae bacterium]|nr:alpha/beta hydrolase [Lachnospiraceae bacterium]
MTVNVDGIDVSYISEGSPMAPHTLVILQGWGTDMSVYESISSFIVSESPDYRVIRLDLPGFGETKEPERAWNIDEYADFFIRFLTALEVRSCILLGHSYGGRIIIKLASRDKKDIPFSIEKLILLDSAGLKAEKTFKQKCSILRYKFLKKVFNNDFVHQLAPDMIDLWFSRQGSADYRNSTPIMKQAMVMAINEDLSDCLSRIPYETLLIWGEKDTATPLKDGEKMNSLIKNSGLSVIKNTGHYCFVEDINTFRSIIRSYLFKAEEE